MLANIERFPTPSPSPVPIQHGSGGRSWQNCSVRRFQDCLDFRVLEHEIPQPVILIEANISEGFRTGERKVAVRVQADSDPEGIRRQVALELVLTDNMEGLITGRSHVEPAVAERLKLSIASVIVLGQPLGERENDGFDAHREPCAEELLRFFLDVDPREPARG